MSRMCLNIEFLAGSDVRDCIVEAKEKALKFDVAYICFKFNGVKFSIGRNCDVDEVLERWEDGPHKYGICYS